MWKRVAVTKQLLGFLLISVLMLKGMFTSEAGDLLGLEKAVGEN